MKKIVVTGATSMIGSALIEECVKHDIEVYAVLRSASGKQDRLPDSSLVHLIDSSLETLDSTVMRYLLSYCLGEHGREPQQKYRITEQEHRLYTGGGESGKCTWL